MLRLAISPHVEKFRAEFRAWLKSHPPPKERGSTSLEDFVRIGRAWQARLASDQWVAVHWPEKFGGRGLSLVEEAVVQEELARAHSPQLLGLFGLSMVGPVLIVHGTAQQQERYLKKILSCEEIWCQGFSEPGAGSDLAAIKTKAEQVDRGFILQGQKTWTSFAHIADRCFVLCRTSSGSQKHKGLSYLLVNMRENGITTRPLRQISGDEEFNEVFFEKVFIPRENIVGAPGDGWKIAISTLMYERVVLTFARQLQSEVALREMLKRFRREKSSEFRARLAREVAHACAVRALSYEHLLQYAAGSMPGPEGSLDKLFWSESFQELSQLAVELCGDDAVRGEAGAAGAAADIHRYLYSRGRTIAAGTSEIQRAIIAERILGLPRSY